MESRRWYIIQTYSGFEHSVKADLEARIVTMGQEDAIFNVLVPQEEYIEIKKDGTKKPKMKEMFPSYVFVEMIVNEKSWFIVRNTPKVTGFLGSSGNGAKPIPLPAEEINVILRKIGKLEKPTSNINVGDSVEVISGPFTGKVVEVSAINEEKETVTVLIEVFGRFTPSELDIKEVVKK